MSTEPSEYDAFGSPAATSIASEIAIPSEPDVSGKRSWNERPAWVRSDGDEWTVAPKVSISTCRYGLPSYDDRTCQISHSRSNTSQANARAEPHWPAPVSVVSLVRPASLLK